jgi:hypothetical protein
MLNKLESSINKTLSKNVVKYSLVLVLMLLTIYVKHLSYNTLKTLNSNFVLVLVGLVIVYFVYVDVVLALALTLFTVVVIQEYQSRKSALNSLSSNVDTGVLANNVSLNNSNKVTSSSSSSEAILNNKLNTNLIPVSSFGADLLYPDKMNTDEVLIYNNQIGEINPTVDNTAQFSEADDKYQTVSLSNPLNANVLDREVFTSLENNNSKNTKPKVVNDPLANSEYDHPASKTMTELLRLKSTSFVDDTMMNKLQSNAASDDLNVPCAVESISCSLNAQSF